VELGTPDTVMILNDWGCGKVFYCGWTGGPDKELRLMRAYDLLFPAIRQDKELLRFVGSRIPWVRTTDDLQELFDPVQPLVDSACIPYRRLGG